MRVLVVNAGSSSLKLAVCEDERLVDADTVERWEAGDLGALRDFLERVGGAGSLDAVGHRVVHGGPLHRRAARVDEELLDYLRSIEDLAPLHNPPALDAMRAVSRLLPDTAAVACFDTTFHADMPVEASTYALPREWNERWSLRRYGFHGLSHSYAARRAAEIVGGKLQDLRLVTCHLGSGASLAAVREGRSVDTTMGFTPLEGLVMRTRSGTVDPGLLLWLQRQAGVEPAELARTLERESGLKGLSGTTGDLRDVLSGRADDKGCRLAYAVFLHRLRREVGAMVASAGGLDVLVLTGGMGEHSAELRADLVAGLGWLGLAIDDDLNTGDPSDADLSTARAVARTVVVAASEETEIARQTADLLG